MSIIFFKSMIGEYVYTDNEHALEADKIVDRDNSKIYYDTGHVIKSYSTMRKELWPRIHVNLEQINTKRRANRKTWLTLSPEF